MQIITAATAKNIANDFINNDCGLIIKKAMNEIWDEAQKGHHTITLFIPTNWDEKTIRNIAVFFSGLGYEVQTLSTCYKIKW